MYQKNRIYIVIVSFSLIFIWGLSWPINKIALNYTSPEVFSLLRIVFALIGLVIMNFFYKNKLVNTRFLGFKESPYIYVFLGIFQIAIFIICINLGLVYINSGIAAILAYTSPFFIYPISIFILKENKFISFQTLGFISGLIGIVIVIISVSNADNIIEFFFFCLLVFLYH